MICCCHRHYLLFKRVYPAWIQVSSAHSSDSYTYDLTSTLSCSRWRKRLAYQCSVRLEFLYGDGKCLHLRGYECNKMPLSMWWCSFRWDSRRQGTSAFVLLILLYWHHFGRRQSLCAHIGPRSLESAKKDSHRHAREGRESADGQGTPFSLTYLLVYNLSLISHPSVAIWCSLAHCWEGHGFRSGVSSSYLPYYWPWWGALG